MSRINNKNGSVIIAALILTLVLGTLVGVYLNTVVQEEELSYRSRMAFQAVNVAEAGINNAIYSFITTDWSDWEAGANGYYRDAFTEISNPPSPDGLEGYTGLGTNENFLVKVYAQKGDPTSDNPDELPVVLAEGIVTLNNGITVSRQIMVRLKHGASDDPTDGGFWGNGILAKTTLTFNGNNQSVDSFNTNDPMGQSSVTDIYETQRTLMGTTFLGHDLAYSNGSVASLSLDASDISLGNADIYGSIATGAGETDTDVKDFIGPNGSIYTAMSASDEDDSFDGSIDNEYVSYDFYASLPDVKVPSDFDLASAETEYEDTLAGTETAYEFTDYYLSSLTLSGSDTLYITGNVRLVVDGDLKVSGTQDARIELAEGANLELFVSGDINISGGGIINSGNPPSLRIYNTGVDTEVTLGGNAAISAAVYAPNSDITLNGGGTGGAFYGAVVGENVTVNGEYDFHYDEALANLPKPDIDPEDGEFIPEVQSWVELTHISEIRNMATILADGI